VEDVACRQESEKIRAIEHEKFSARGFEANDGGAILLTESSCCSAHSHRDAEESA